MFIGTATRTTGVTREILKPLGSFSDVFSTPGSSYYFPLLLLLFNSQSSDAGHKRKLRGFGANEEVCKIIDNLP